MSAQRIESLKKQHNMLEQQIEIENKHVNPDEILIKQLKKEKLAIKDQLTILSINNASI